MGMVSINSESSASNKLNADTLDGKHASDFISPLGIVENTDLNEIKYPCSFVANTTCTNCPVSNVWGTVLVYAGGSGSVTQIYVPTVVDGAQPSMWFRHYGGTGWSSWRNTADSGVANSVKSANAQVRLWENTEGGNLRLTSPDGNHYVEMDIYNNSAFRMYFAENVEDNLTSAATYDFSTKKFNINGNASTVNGHSVNSDVPANAKFTDTNTTYSNFVKSGSGAKSGLVPAPSTTAGTTKYLREDGTWQTPPNTTYSAASTSANGLVTTGAQTLAGLKTFNGGAKIGNTPAITDVVARNIRAVASANVSTVTTSNLPAGSICFVY